MSKVGMNKPAGYKTPPLFLLSDRRGIKDEIVDDLMAAKTTYRYQGGYYNYY